MTLALYSIHQLLDEIRSRSRSIVLGVAYKTNDPSADYATIIEGSFLECLGLASEINEDMKFRQRLALRESAERAAEEDAAAEEEDDEEEA